MIRETQSVAKEYHYQPYRTKKKNNLKLFIIGLLVIIVVGGYIVHNRNQRSKTRGMDDSQGQTTDRNEADSSHLREVDIQPMDRPITKPEDKTPVAPQTSPSATPVQPITQTPPASPSNPAQPQPALPQPGPVVVSAGGQTPGVPNQTVTEQGTIPATDSSSPEARTLIDQALMEEKAGKIISARDKYNQSLSMRLSPQVRDAVKDRLTALSRKWLFSPEIYPEDTITESFKVATGDRLETIGKSYKIPYELLMRINNLKNPRLLQAGKTIKAVKGPFHLKAYRSSFTLEVWLDNKVFVKRYKIGLGAEGKETPTGTWKVKSNGKLIQPPWPNPDTGKIVHPDDPEYPLGTRWIGLDGIDGKAKDRTGFGIHGTKEPESIGKRSSQGCIRLFNGEVQELYDLMTQGVSEVVVAD